MSDKQIWLTVALDLKRAANYLCNKRFRQAEYYLGEAKRLYESLGPKNKMESKKRFIRFEGDPEDILLGSSIILGRI